MHVAWGKANRGNHITSKILKNYNVRGKINLYTCEDRIQIWL